MNKFGILKVGDTVSWRDGWGREEPQPAKVTSIQKDCVYKEGKEVSEIRWYHVLDSKRVIVTLENGSWAYGNQINPI